MKISCEVTLSPLSSHSAALERRDAKSSFWHPCPSRWDASLQLLSRSSAAGRVRARTFPWKHISLVSAEEAAEGALGPRRGEAAARLPRPAARRSGREPQDPSRSPTSFAACQRGPGEAEEGIRIFKCCPWVKGCAGTLLPSEVACLSSAKVKLGLATEEMGYCEQLSFSVSPLDPPSLQQAIWENAFPHHAQWLAQKHLVVSPRLLRYSWVLHVFGICRPQRENKRNAMRFNCFLCI